jgi:manganese oxidase
MNAMGHQVKNFIGLAERDLGKALAGAAPNAMAMGTEGMAMMGEMEMPLPPNTLPMMTGTGPFGPVEMGGMFTVMKVRDGLEPGDYRDPGWYKHPQGTVAYEIDVAAAGTTQGQPGAGESPGMTKMPGMEMQLQPSGDGHQHHH